MKKTLSTIIIMLLFAVLSCEENIKKDIPLCRTKAEIAAHNGKVVTLEGVFHAADAGKTWVTYIVLSDKTYVVYRYTRLDNLEGKKAEVTGTVYKSGYPSDHMVQMLLAPHIIRVTTVKMLN